MRPTQFDIQLEVVHVFVCTVNVSQEEIEKEEGDEWARSEARVHRLLSENHRLAEQLRETQHSLQIHSNGWRRERNKATALMFSMSPSLLLL